MRGEWTAVHLSICKKSSADAVATFNRLNRENLIVVEGRRGWTPGLPAYLLPNEKKSNVARKIDILSPKKTRLTNHGALNRGMWYQKNRGGKTDEIVPVRG